MKIEFKMKGTEPMPLFDRSMRYATRLKCEEREQIAHLVTTPETKKILKIVNYAVNVCVPLIVCLLTNCNLIVVAIAFMLTDMILWSIDEHIMIIWPHKQTSRCSLSDVQQSLKELVEKRDELRSLCINGYSNADSTLKMQNELKALNTYIKYETEWIEQKLVPMKEAEMRADRKKSRDYTDKREYLLATKSKLAYFITEHHMDFLNQVVSSIDLLIDTLDTKPEEYKTVPNTLYLYIDELQGILNKMIDLKEERYNMYTKDLERISSALSRNINNCVEHIYESEKMEIEVSISVLSNLLTENGVIDNA